MTRDNNLIAMCKLFVLLGIVAVALIILILYGVQFLFSKNVSLVQEHCIHDDTVIARTTSLQVLDLIHDSDYNSNLFSDNYPLQRITKRNVRKLTETDKISFKDITFINNYPTYTFDINFPSFECFQNTSFHFLYENFKMSYDVANQISANTFEIRDIPLEKVSRVIYLVRLIVASLLELDETFKVELPVNYWNKEKCKLIARCNIAILYSDAYKAMFQCRRSSRESSHLSPFPRYSMKKEKFKSLFFTFNEIEGSLDEFLSIHTALTLKTLQQTTNKVMEMLEQELSIIPIQKSALLSIFKSNSTFFESHFGKDIVRSGNDTLDKFDYMAFRYPNLYGDKSIEYFTFLIQFSSIYLHNYSMDYQQIESGISINERTSTHSYLKSFISNDMKSPHFHIPSLHNAYEQIFEKSLVQNSKSILLENDFRKRMIQSLDEMIYLTEVDNYY